MCGFWCDYKDNDFRSIGMSNVCFSSCPSISHSIGHQFSSSLSPSRSFGSCFRRTRDWYIQCSPPCFLPVHSQYIFPAALWFFTFLTLVFCHRQFVCYTWWCDRTHKFVEASKMSWKMAQHLFRATVRAPIYDGKIELFLRYNMFKFFDIFLLCF